MAGRFGDLLWYPPAVAPFAAVSSADACPDLESAVRAGLGTQAYFEGICPNVLPAGWRIVSRSNILQLFPGAECLRIAECAGSGEDAGTVLGERDRTAMWELTRLAAAGCQEISDVCTHPDHAEKGHARRLTRALLARHAARGVGTLLHVSESNAAARRLYASMGFDVRATLPMCKVERAAG